MKKNFILIILLLFIFINKVQAEEKSLKLTDFSQNETMIAEENYLIVGNFKNDFIDFTSSLNSINHFTNKYCFNKHGNNYNSQLIQISANVAYAYCKKINELDEFNLTESEKNCLLSYEHDLSIDPLYNKECAEISIDFELILTEVQKYRKKINFLSSNAFIYEILNEDLSKKISNFEAKILFSDTYNLKQELAALENPLKEPFDINIVNRNIKLCKLYEFEKGSDLYFQCILTLLDNQATSGLININSKKSK